MRKAAKQQPRKKSGSAEKKRIWPVALFLAVLLADIATKAVVENSGLEKDFGFFAIRLVRNTGASFGMFKTLPNINFIFIIISALVLAGCLFFFRHRASKLKDKLAAPLALLSAGIAGNMADRIFKGAVVDFIDFKFWPVFNIADAAINIGCVWLIMMLAFKKENNTKIASAEKTMDTKEKKPKESDKNIDKTRTEPASEKK